jgi:AraC-like DNA-binding protein
MDRTPHDEVVPPWKSAAGDGLVRVREYHCTACRGDPPQAEQFERVSIGIVRSGVFGIRTGQRTKLLSTGFLLLGNAGQNYEASHEHGGGDRCLVFDFGPRTVEDLADTLRQGTRADPFAQNVLPPHPRFEAFRALADEQLALGSGELGLEELGLSLASWVLAQAGAGSRRSRLELPDDPGKSLTRDNRQAREHVALAIDRLERAGPGALGLAELAASVGLSPFHFLRLFKRETGVTPHRFLIQTRIRRAIALLRETSRPVTDIAFDVGFGDLSNFINAFRREMGVSPRKYRLSGL